MYLDVKKYCVLSKGKNDLYRNRLVDFSFYAISFTKII